MIITPPGLQIANIIQTNRRPVTRYQHLDIISQPSRLDRSSLVGVLSISITINIILYLAPDVDIALVGQGISRISTGSNKPNEITLTQSEFVGDLDRLIPILTTLAALP